MAKLFPSLTLAAALSTISFAASADPTKNLLSAPGPHMCVPGTQFSCSCGDGSTGIATCNPNGLGLSVCACAKVRVSVPMPVIMVPDIRVRRVPMRKRKSAPLPGLALLLGGACTLGTGAFNVGFGVERIRDKGKDPFGIVSVALGGTAMLIGLPLTIVGIVRYANEPKEVDKDKDAKKSDTGIRFAPTADGFALHF